MNMLQMIAELRGNIPECCDFCGQPYNDQRHPTPDEGGEWACTECWKRWDAEDAMRKKEQEETK
jgi:hypothetical protein